jgi:TetR/AcrR family transcriptional regulator, cholesterol catabolism regulator
MEIMQRGHNSMPPRAAQRKADVSRSQILLAAAKLFSQKGYFASSVREVAENANMKAGSVYYHFESKEQILDGVLNTGILLITQAFEQALAGLPAHASFDDKFRAGVRAHLHTLLKDSDHASAYIRIYGQLPPLIKRRSHEVRRAYQQLWIELLATGQSDGAIRTDLDLKLMVPLILGMLNRTMEWYNPKHISLDDLVETSLALLLSGIAAKASVAKPRGVVPSYS